MDGINTILRIVTWVIIPTSALLIWSQLQDSDLDNALRSTVAGVVGMVPEGLVLLTSIAFMVAAVTLARRKVLVQELPAVEGLARVDVVCLDKTGTLTEGEIVFDELERLDDDRRACRRRARRARRRRERATRPSSRSAASFPPPDGWTRTGAVPFSSARKWSAASFDGQGLVGDRCARDGAHRRRPSPRAAQANELAATGRRVLRARPRRRAARR